MPKRSVLQQHCRRRAGGGALNSTLGPACLALWHQQLQLPALQAQQQEGREPPKHTTRRDGRLPCLDTAYETSKPHQHHKQALINITGIE